METSPSRSAIWWKQVPVGRMQNFSYLVGCPENKECAVVDCGFEPEKIARFAKNEGFTITKILLTHVHYDHSGSAEVLSGLTGAKIYMNPESQRKHDTLIERGMWSVPKKTTPLLPGDRVSVGNLSGRVIGAPGHQNDHLLLLFDPYLFTGDTLFIGRIGRTDFVDSDPQKMQETLNKIITLPDHLIVCPGHDYGSVKTRSLREEKVINPHLRSIIEQNS